jgi:hypothetical protein
MVSLRMANYYKMQKVLVHTAVLSFLTFHRNLKEETHLALDTYVAAAP